MYFLLHQETSIHKCARAGYIQWHCSTYQQQCTYIQRPVVMASSMQQPEKLSWQWHTYTPPYVCSYLGEGIAWQMSTPPTLCRSLQYSNTVSILAYTQLTECSYTASILLQAGGALPPPDPPRLFQQILHVSQSMQTTATGRNRPQLQARHMCQ